MKVGTIIRFIVIVVVTISIAACKSIKSDSVSEKLIGTWVLDSVSTYKNEYYKATTTLKFTFKNESEYMSEWQDYDIGNKTEGKYIVIAVPKRSLATVLFISNIQMQGRDTVRIDIPNFDIVDLNEQRLQTIEQTKFLPKKDESSIIFNKHCIYKRVR